MVCKKRGTYGFLGTSWVLITMHPRKITCLSKRQNVVETDKSLTKIEIKRNEKQDAMVCNEKSKLKKLLLY